jgi:pantetheine-phosphate adenylyltransferase
VSARVAVFGGTFDPVTHGHLDLVRRGAALFDRLVVCVSARGRDTLFTLEERLALLRPLVADLPGVQVRPFEGLLVDAARRLGASALLRGIRGATDLEVELQMAQANRDLAPDLETVFLAPSAATSRVSSTLVRQVGLLGGDVDAWVAPAVAAAIAAKRAARG